MATDGSALLDMQERQRALLCAQKADRERAISITQAQFLAEEPTGKRKREAEQAEAEAQQQRKLAALEQRVLSSASNLEACKQGLPALEGACSLAFEAYAEARAELVQEKQKVERVEATHTALVQLLSDCQDVHRAGAAATYTDDM